MFSSIGLWAITVPITFVIVLMVILLQMNKDSFTVLTREKERLENEVHTLTERSVRLASEAQLLTANLKSKQQRYEDIVLDKQRMCEELEARYTIVMVQQEALLEQKGMLEYWNESLYTETTELQLKIDTLMAKICRTEIAVQNAHKFWQGQRSKERKARQEYEEELESTINSLKQNGLKHSKGYQKEVNELNAMMAHYSRQIQRRENRIQELEMYVRELEYQKRALVNNLEKLRMRCDVERESKHSAQEHISSLQAEVAALKAQTSRLEEGLQTKSNSRRLRFLRRPPSSEVIDSRLEKMRNEFETRIVDLQSKFERQHAEELHQLRAEREELRKELELANRHNTQGQRRPAHEELVQPSLYERKKRLSHTKLRVRRAKEKLQRQLSFTRVDDFCTQPEPSFISARNGHTEYRLSDYSPWR